MAAEPFRESRCTTVIYEGLKCWDRKTTLGLSRKEGLQDHLLCEQALSCLTVEAKLNQDQRIFPTSSVSLAISSRFPIRPCNIEPQWGSSASIRNFVELLALGQKEASFALSTRQPLPPPPSATGATLIHAKAG